MVSKLVYIGNLGEGYDLETVISAVNRSEQLSLDIAGKGPKESSLMAIAGKRVTFHGYLNSVELMNLLARCEVGVIPMRDDSWVGLPYKLGDYLKAGLKVVSSLKGECAALIEKYDLGATYEYGSVEDLLKQLENLEVGSKGSVTLPPEVDAAEIYPKYVRYVTRDLAD